MIYAENFILAYSSPALTGGSLPWARLQLFSMPGGFEKDLLTSLIPQASPSDVSEKKTLYDTKRRDIMFLL